MEEILKQNLAIEPDLQNFIDFVLQSVAKLGGNAFVASITWPAAVFALSQFLQEMPVFQTALEITHE